MRSSIIGLFSLVVSLIVNAQTSWSLPPEKSEVSKNTDSSEELKHAELEADDAELEKLVLSALNNWQTNWSLFFDLEETSKRTLGIHWHSLSKDEITTFRNEYERFFLAQHAYALSKRKHCPVKLETKRIQTTIRVDVFSAKKGCNEPPLSYYLHPLAEKPGWRIFDFSDHNIHAVPSNRYFADQVIKKDGIAGLVSKFQAALRNGRFELTDLDPKMLESRN